MLFDVVVVVVEVVNDLGILRSNLCLDKGDKGGISSYGLGGYQGLCIIIINLFFRVLIIIRYLGYLL